MGNLGLVKNASSTPAQPTQTRILTIDVLRGFALFGILYAHMIFWYSGGPFPQAVYQTYKDIPSLIAIGLVALLFNGKFFSIFSFLFGLSFYIQIKGLAAKHENVMTRFGWRLFILGVIGVVHHIFWRADILSIYVPLGFLLLFARDLSNKTILILGAVLILNIPTKIIEIISIVVQGKPEFMPDTFTQDSEAYFAVVSDGSLLQTMQHNFYALKEKFNFQISSGRLLITFGFFLLGMLAGRLKWFEDIETAQPLFKNVWKKAGWTLICVAVFSIILGTAIFALKVEIKDAPWVRWIGGSIVDLYNATLALFYIASIALLMQKPKWFARLAPLSYIGKMALTSYLSQTLFGLLLFFHFGLGLFLDTSPAMNIILCCVIFGLQIFFCKYWLQKFNYGPIEWLWRSATYLKWQPMRKREKLGLAV